MSEFKVVAFSGAAGCGKDTAATFLQQFGFIRYAFASPIKAGLNAIFGWEPWQWDDRVWKEAVLPKIGKSPRQLAQTLGTEWGRCLVNQQLWLLLAESAMGNARSVGARGIVFTDCRFENEAAFVRDSLSGIVVRIERGDAPTIAAHVSEQGVPDPLINTIIPNNGSIIDLYEQVRRTVSV